MPRSLLASLMILFATPAFAGSRFGGFHGGSFPVFHPSGALVLGFFGGYLCGFNCGLGFYNPGYGYFDGYSYGYFNGLGYGNGYFNGYGYFNRYGYLNRYGNGYDYGSGAGNAASISNGLTGGYVPDPVGAEIPPLIIPKNCWVRRPAYEPSGAYFGPVLINLCRPSDRITVTGLKAPVETPDTGTGADQRPTPGVPQSSPMDGKAP